MITNISNNNQAFVVMPFAANFNDVYQVIKSACSEINLKVVRADEIFHTNEIMDVVFSEISKSKIIIADVSNKNPNVIYELGIAHTLHKPVIILAQDIDDVPFDYRHRQVYIYSLENTNWKEQLERMIVDLFQQIRGKYEVVNWMDSRLETEASIKEFLLRTYTSGKTTLNFESTIECDLKGNVTVDQDWIIFPDVNMSHLYHEIYIDKPGEIRIEEITDVYYGAALSPYIRDYSSKQLRYFVLFKDLKPSGIQFMINIKYSAENYMSNLFEKNKVVMFYKNSRGTSVTFGYRTEKYIFPRNSKTEKLRVKYIENASSEEEIIFPELKKDKVVVILSYKADTEGGFSSIFYFEK